MPETPVHGYNIPDRGETNWDDLLNQNFEDMDLEVEVRGSGTPSTNNVTPANGAKYFDTDTGIVYTAPSGSWEPTHAIG